MTATPPNDADPARPAAAPRTARRRLLARILMAFGVACLLASAGTALGWMRAAERSSQRTHAPNDRSVHADRSWEIPPPPPDAVEVLAQNRDHRFQGLYESGLADKDVLTFYRSWFTAKGFTEEPATGMKDTSVFLRGPDRADITLFPPRGDQAGCDFRVAIIRRARP